MNAHQRRTYIRKHTELVTSTIPLMVMCDQPRRAQRANDRWQLPDSLERIKAVDICKRFRTNPPGSDIPAWGDLMWDESVRRKWAEGLRRAALRKSTFQTLVAPPEAVAHHDDVIDTVSTLTTGLQGKKVVSVIHDETTFLPP